MIKAIDYWYNEVRLYNFFRPGFRKSTRYFTQLVWKETTHIGIGAAIGYRDSMECIYVVANYSPAGNYMNQFSNNVLRP